MRLKEQIINQGLTYKQVAQAVGIDKYQLSKFANYVCLPTPEQANSLCNVLNCNILDIYNKKELTFKMPPKSHESINNGKEYYNLHVRLDKDCCNFFIKENLIKLGYKNIAQWLYDCMFDFECRVIRNSLIDKIEQQTGENYARARKRY